jgi:hypothetical protein
MDSKSSCQQRINYDSRLWLETANALHGLEFLTKVLEGTD